MAQRQRAACHMASTGKQPECSSNARHGAGPAGRKARTWDAREKTRPWKAALPGRVKYLTQTQEAQGRKGDSGSFASAKHGFHTLPFYAHTERLSDLNDPPQ